MESHHLRSDLPHQGTSQATEQNFSSQPPDNQPVAIAVTSGERGNDAPMEDNDTDSPDLQYLITSISPSAKETNVGLPSEPMVIDQPGPSALPPAAAPVVAQQALPPNYPPVPYPQPYYYSSDGYLSAFPITEASVYGDGQPDGMDQGQVSQADGLEVDEEDEDEEDNESELSDGDVLKDDIDEALTNNDALFKGNYYHASLLSTAPNPCLHVAGVGLIGLPLSERDATIIISHATLAPFGRGERTVVDKDVRDTWEIEPARLYFGNPAWVPFVNSTVRQQICQSLGVAEGQTPPRLDLYKLLLYEEGSHFLPHQDTQKADGMFATVIIVLPSQYTGGQVVVSHSSSSKVVDFAANSLLSTVLLAWFTDVRHEVKPITSGYRLALAYNMIHTAPPGVPKPGLPQMDSAAEKLRRILKKWGADRYSEVPDPALIAYVLNHEYSDDNLGEGIRALKGADLHRVTFLRDVAEEEGFTVGLAHLSHHESGYADDDGGYSERKRYRYDSYSEDSDEGTPGMAEVSSTETTLEDLVDLEGDAILSLGSIKIDKESILPVEYFDGEEPDDTEYEGYMGNGAGGLEQWYHRTALVLMHGDDIDSICFSVGGIPYALDKLKKASNPPTGDDRAWAARIVSRPTSVTAEHAKAMLTLALNWKDLTTWKGIMQAPACTLHSISENQLFEGWRTFSFAAVKQGFEALLARSKQLSAQIDFLRHIQSQATPDERELVATWSKRESDKILTSYGSADPTDIPTIISIILSAGLSSFNNLMLPNLTKLPNSYSFWIAFIKSLWQNRQAILDHETQLSNMCVDSNTASGSAGSSTSQLQASGVTRGDLPAPSMATTLIDTLVARCFQAAASQWSAIPAPRYVYSYGYGAPSHTNKVDRITEIIQVALEVNKVDACRTLFVDILKSPGTTHDKFDQIYKPLISRLRPLLRARNHDIFVSPFVDLYQIFIGSYLREILGKKGVMSPKLRRIGCGCQDCQMVDAFILDPRRATQLFRLLKARRLHIERYIAAAKDLCTFRVINSGSPHGVEVTKRPEFVAATMWSCKQNEARKFLGTVGTDDVIQRIMGPRYPDVVAAVNGSTSFGSITTNLNPPLDLTQTITPSPSTSTGATGMTTAPSAIGLDSSDVSSSVPQLAGQKRKTRPTQPLVNLGTIDLTGLDSD